MKSILQVAIALSLASNVVAHATPWNLLFEDMMHSIESPSFKVEQLPGACSAVQSPEAHRQFLASFEQMPGVYTTLCLENPRVKDLFVTEYARDALTQPEVISRIEERKKAYCEYNPAFRLCILCKVNLSQIVAQRSVGVLGAYAECKNWWGAN